MKLRQTGFPDLPLRPALALVCLVSAASTASGQTLSERLKAEPAAALATAARQQGQAVRGAILFPRQKLGCTACHAPGNEKLLGPDLTRLGPDTTDVSLVEALLEPSKTIRKGFETVTVVTTAGRSVTGRILEQSPQTMVLRDTSPARRRISLARSDVEEVLPVKTSSMPDKLVDTLQDRQEFLDLVRYLMEIATTGSDRPPVDARHGETISRELQGYVLLNEFHCGACHADDVARTAIPERLAPDLAWSAGRVDPDYLLAFIANPQQVKPGTTMPDLPGSLSAAERRRVALEITHYLVSQSDRRFSVQPVDAAAATRGRTLFHQVGCVACHAPRNDDGKELLAETSVPLGPLEKKYSIHSLADFLEHPHAARPAGRMPDLQLTHWEALDLAHFLAARATLPNDRQPFVPNASLAARGRREFEQRGCVHCHRPQTADRGSVSRSLSQVRTEQGCLSGTAGAWPRFHLSPSQRQAMQAALTSGRDSLSDREQIDVSLTALRCLNCHQRGALGGVSADRDAYFQTTNPNLGPQGRIPPTLTNVGARLQPKWMRQVLVSGRAIRPYVLTRMPQYGTENTEHLIDLLQRTDTLPEVRFAGFADQKAMRTTGAEMAGTGGLNCIVCHTFQLKQTALMPAVDLTEMAERLQKTWFYHYMRNPQRHSLNTVMPSFWPGGRAIRQDILDGNPDLQIEALWQYLLDGRQARRPRGVVIEPIELLATDEAVMLRRSYQGIGKRGIGVGYPAQVNMAFDAEQLRWGLLWRGRFADPGGVWRGQGHGTVRPLSREVVRFTAGPDLDDAESPWTSTAGRPARHRFRGYTLDDRQRPRFRYEFDGIAVQDYAIDRKDTQTQQPVLRRTIRLQSSQGRPGTVFRVASGKKIQAAGDRQFLIDGRLRVRIGADYPARIVTTSTDTQLQIPLDVPGGTTTLVMEYTW